MRPPIQGFLFLLVFCICLALILCLFFIPAAGGDSEGKHIYRAVFPGSHDHSFSAGMLSLSSGSGSENSFFTQRE